MNSTNIRPRWWQLYLSFPLLLALFVMDNRLKISARGHQAVQIGIILLVYGLIHLWLKSNARALSRMDQQEYHSTFRVIRVPPVQDSEWRYERSSILRLPESEIQGLLSDGMDMSYVDPELMKEMHKN